MIFIRSSIYFLSMVISVVVFGGLAALAGWFLPGHLSDRIATAWGRTNLVLMKWLCGLKFEVHGELPSEACIVMANHQSTWETISLRGLLPPEQSWILKKELLSVPIFGRALRLAKSIPIDRSMGRKAVITLVREGEKHLSDGRIVVIFPEGTRTAVGENKKYGIGGGVLAQKSGYPVVPVAHNAGVFWKRRGVKKYPGTVQLVVGKPIDTTGKKAADIIQEVQDWIQARQAELPTETG